MLFRSVSRFRHRKGGFRARAIARAHLAGTTVALKRRVPAGTFTRSFVEVGGLMSYGPNAARSFQRGVYFTIRILQGSKPADLPAEQPTHFELVINLKTAKALGVNVPASLLARADDVIR